MRVAVVQNMSPGGAWRTLVEQCRDPRRLGFCRGASNDGSLEFLKAREEGPLDVAVSPRNPLRYPPNLRRRYRALTLSEYFDDIRPGDWKGGVQCQDVQRLTYPDDSFDLVTSTEVFEHVPDDTSAFREVHRVLGPGGHLVFTVPLFDQARTVERARLDGGAVVHLLPPEYHHDRIRGRGRVPAFRNYGRDICRRLGAAGLEAEIRVVHAPRHAVFAIKVVVARKAALEPGPWP